MSSTGHAATKLRVLDLFAGAGGLSEGLRQSGHFKTVQAVELDSSAAATYSLNHPDAGLYVGAIQKWLSRSVIPQVDVIIGGPPCQGFSLLGKQDLQDERNVLWREYARTIVLARPAYFVVENVAAFLKSPQFELFRREAQPGGMLAEYDMQSTVLNAADYGAPQARRRAVLIGHRRDVPFPGWPVKTHDDNHRTVQQAFAAVQTYLVRDLPARWYDFNGANLAGPFKTTELHVSRQYSDLSLQRFACIPPGGNRFHIEERLLAPCWKKHLSGSGDVMGRLRWERPSVTIRTEFFKPEKGRYLHPEEHRAITHFEAALLQGFPLDYRWVGTKVSIARQIGNAVPVPLGKAIGERIGESAALHRATRSTPARP